MSERAHDNSRPAAAATRIRILAVALELFATKGYAGTSIRDIAEEMGLTKASLYYHFESKEQILQAVTEPMRRDMELMVQRASELPRPSPAEILSGMVDTLSRDALLLQTLFHDPSSVHREQHEEALRHMRFLVRFLAGSDDPSDLLRARCAVGAVQFGVLGTLKSDPCTVEPPRGEQAIRVMAGQAHVLDAEQRQAVVSAALRALDYQPDP